MDLLNLLIHNGEDITLFGDSELYMSPEYIQLTREARALRQRLLDDCGPTIQALLDEYTEMVETKEDFIATHYFEQGFLAGRRAIQKERD